LATTWLPPEDAECLDLCSAATTHTSFTGLGTQTAWGKRGTGVHSSRCISSISCSGGLLSFFAHLSRILVECASEQEFVPGVAILIVRAIAKCRRFSQEHTFQSQTRSFFGSTTPQTTDRGPSSTFCVRQAPAAVHLVLVRGRFCPLGPQAQGPAFSRKRICGPRRYGGSGNGSGSGREIIITSDQRSSVAFLLRRQWPMY